MLDWKGKNSSYIGLMTKRTGLYCRLGILQSSNDLLKFLVKYLDPNPYSEYGSASKRPLNTDQMRIQNKTIDCRLVVHQHQDRDASDKHTRKLTDALQAVLTGPRRVNAQVNTIKAS